MNKKFQLNSEDKHSNNIENQLKCQMNTLQAQYQLDNVCKELAKVGRHFEDYNTYWELNRSEVYSIEGAMFNTEDIFGEPISFNVNKEYVQAILQGLANVSYALKIVQKLLDKPYRNSKHATEILKRVEEQGFNLGELESNL